MDLFKADAKTKIVIKREQIIAIRLQTKNGRTETQSSSLRDSTKRKTIRRQSGNHNITKVSSSGYFCHQLFREGCNKDFR